MSSLTPEHAPAIHVPNYTYRHCSRVTQVNEAFQIRPGGVDSTVQLEGDVVNAEGSGTSMENVCLPIHTHQAGCCHLTVQQAMRRHEKVLKLLRYPTLPHHRVMLIVYTIYGSHNIR
jgi:hypothetical protein